MKDVQFYYRDMLRAIACQLDYEIGDCPLEDPTHEKSIMQLEDFVTYQKNKIPTSKFFFEVGRAAQYTDDKFDNGKYDKADYPLFIEALDMFQKFTGVEGTTQNEV